MGDAAAERGVSEDPPWIPMTREMLAESLVFYRRRLTEKIIVAMIRAGDTDVESIKTQYRDPAMFAEDLANAICERLAARETGDARGYR